MTLFPSDGKTINTYLPSELLREIFLYSIESNQMKSGHLASVCRYWRSVITTTSHLWSTLRVGTWTEREQVATWLQRAYPKKVIIDTQKDGEMPSINPFAALQDALTSSNEWHELTISSFPPEDLASQLDLQGARPMNVLKTLHVVSGCVHSPSFTHLLELVRTEAPLSELRLHPSFASAYFLQSSWFPVLQNLTVLIVNGRDIQEPFELLHAFTQLHTFEADHLRIPFYELNADLPLLCTLQKLHLRASSVQWMAGRQFPCLEECAILLPHFWEAVQRHEVQLPSCKKLTYHGYPMTTVQSFRVPQMREMELVSHDSREQRVYQQLRHLCTLDDRISKLTTLHLTLMCSEQVLMKVLKHMSSLQELVLSIAYPSLLWQRFLESLAANPSTKYHPEWDISGSDDWHWGQWCSSQTWHADVLPNLKSLSIQCPRGFSQAECHVNFPLLRLIGWTRAQLSPPLEHLKVWEGRGTTDDIVVDYISTGYLNKHARISSNGYDSMIVKGMATQCLVIHSYTTPLFRLHSTVLFRQLQDLKFNYFRHDEIPILPYLEQIRKLNIRQGIIPAYSLSIDLPLVHTLQFLELFFSNITWMFGRSFKALTEFRVHEPLDGPNLSRYEQLRVGLPACTTLTLASFSVNHLHFFSCPNIQTLQLQQSPMWSAVDEAALKSLQEFLCSCSCLQKLEVLIYQIRGLDSLIQFVFCDAWKHGVWQDIRSVEVKVPFSHSSRSGGYHFFNQMVGRQQYYEKWWNEFTVAMEDWDVMVIIRASV